MVIGPPERSVGVGPDPRGILGIHLVNGRLERDGKLLGDVPVDAVHLVGPREPILRDRPLPASDMGDLLGLGELPLALAEPPLGFLPFGDLLPELQVGFGELGGPLPHPRFQPGRGALQRLMGMQPLRHHGSEEERAEGDRRIERLECEHPLEHRPGSERPDPLGGRPRGDHHDKQGSRRRPPLLEPPGRPPQQRDHQEHQAPIGTNRHHGYHCGQGEQHRGFEVLPAESARSAPWQYQAEDERGDHEDAHGVACPPHRPGAQQLIRWQRSRCCEDPCANRGADAHAQQGTDKDDGSGIS